MTVAERESAGRKPAPVLVDASTGAARSPRTGVRPPAGWRVQLGAFRSKSRAAKARTTLSQTLAGLLRGGALVIDDSKDDGLFRVILADAFAHRGEAAATCAAIAVRGAQCFVARAPASYPVLERLDRLEAENAQLRKEIEALKAERTKPVGAPPSRADPAVETTAARFVRTDSKFGYDSRLCGGGRATAEAAAPVRVRKHRVPGVRPAASHACTGPVHSVIRRSSGSVDGCLERA